MASTTADTGGPRGKERAAELEQYTIEQIPLDQRHGKPRDLFTIWFTSNLMPLTIITGALTTAVFGLPFWASVIAIVVGNLVGAIFMALHSAQGPKLGIPQMIQSRAEELKLTPEQKDKLTKLGTDMQDKMAKIRESAGNDRQAMGTAMRTAFQDLQAKLKESLTPEQMDKVQQMMPARGQGGGGQGGGGQGGGGRRGGGGGQGGGAGNIQ